MWPESQTSDFVLTITSAPSCNTSHAALPQREHPHQPRCPWSTLQRPEDVHEFLQCLHDIFMTKIRSLNGSLRYVAMDDHYGGSLPNFWTFQNLRSITQRAAGHGNAQEGCCSAHSMFGEWRLEQRGMFEIPVKWHILQHSQITVSPNSQMCESSLKLQLHSPINIPKGC